jgi:hypothetical protein
MRYVLIGLLALLPFGASAPAYAICCWNPAICNAVCGSACCGENLTIATPVDPAALGRFSVQDLQKAQAESSKVSARSDFLTVLQKEIARRSSSPARTP